MIEFIILIELVQSQTLRGSFQLTHRVILGRFISYDILGWNYS